MPGMVGGYGNYFLPVHCGSPDMANKKFKLNKWLKSFFTLYIYPTNLIIISTILKRHPSVGCVDAFASFFFKKNIKNIKKLATLIINKSNKLGLFALGVFDYFKISLFNCIYSLASGSGSSIKQNSRNLLNRANIKPNFIEEKEQNLSHYLAGLIEGDGYISITNINRIILGITFNLKDKPLVEKLLKTLGTGSIVKRKSNSIELRFSSKKTLYKIIHLINGKFRTPKIDQLYKLID
jgi:hypothetical protein